MAFTNELHNQQMRSNLKSVVIACLVVIALGQYLLLLKYPSSFTIDLPPDLSTAQKVKPGYVYPSTAHQFATTFFQYLNTWNRSGEKDYKDRRNQIRAYITQDFYNSLKKDYQHKLNAGELKNRTRTMKLSEGGIYQPGFVTTYDDYWVCKVRFDLEERVYGQVVKSAKLEYSLIVVKHNIDPVHNPYQLAISGFSKAPRIIEDNQ